MAVGDRFASGCLTETKLVAQGVERVEADCQPIPGAGFLRAPERRTGFSQLAHQICVAAGQGSRRA